ncbi:cell division protein FtsH, partial [Sinorhizobium meliloti]
MNPNFRNFALWAIIALLLIALFSMFQQPTERAGSREIPFSQFLKDVDASRVKDVVITGSKVIGSYTESGATFQT